MARFLLSLFNFVLMFAVCIPPAWYVYHLRHSCSSGVPPQPPPPSSDSGLLALTGGSTIEELAELSSEWFQALPGDVSTLLTAAGAAAAPPRPLLSPVACKVYEHYPRLFVNLLYFVVVDVGFYLIYLLQSSTWLIDPHWQLIPVCISLFSFTHPDSSSSSGSGGGEKNLRAYLALGLLLLWATRLMHNYVRRERLRFGESEDWRYNDMRKSQGKLFLVSQFFSVSLAQHGMLVGLTMPLQLAMRYGNGGGDGGDDLNILDLIATLVCLAGITIGFFADNQLWAYMNTPNKPLVLETGLWRYSRHPNHFGEQTWWIGLLLLGVAGVGTTAATATATPQVGVSSFADLWSLVVAAGPYWWAISFGVCFNHPLDTLVTLPLIEGRMLRREARAPLFRQYMAKTSLVVPWFVKKLKKNDNGGESSTKKIN